MAFSGNKLASPWTITHNNLVGPIYRGAVIKKKKKVRSWCLIKAAGANLPISIFSTWTWSAARRSQLSVALFPSSASLSCCPNVEWWFTTPWACPQLSVYLCEVGRGSFPNPPPWGSNFEWTRHFIWYNKCISQEKGNNKMLPCPKSSWLLTNKEPESKIADWVSPRKCIPHHFLLPPLWPSQLLWPPTCPGLSHPHPLLPQSPDSFSKPLWGPGAGPLEGSLDEGGG